MGSIASLVLVPILASALVVAAEPGDQLARPGEGTMFTVRTAIDAMRGVHLASLSADQQAALAKRLDAAWDYLSKVGPEGRKALEDAVKGAETATPTDSFFLLDASRLLIGVTPNYPAQKTIAREALRNADLAESAEDAFYLFYLLAVDRKREDLPTIVRVLGLPDAAQARVMAHALTLDWRLQQLFVLGVFGSDALPAVREGLRSADPLFRRGAAHVAGMFFDDRSLPAFRELLKDKDPRVAAEAARAIGSVGREEDVATLGALVSQAADPEVRFAAAFALYDLTNPKAVPALVQGLVDARKEVRGECVSGLLLYHSAEALGALVARLPNETDADVRRSILKGLGREGTMAHAAELQGYASGGRLAKTVELEACLRDVRARGALEPRPWEGVPPRQEAPDKMDAACRDLIGNSGRVTDALGEILGRHAGPEDVSCLEEARAIALKRLSDEGLYDWRALTSVIKVARMRGASMPHRP